MIYSDFALFFGCFCQEEGCFYVVLVMGDVVYGAKMRRYEKYFCMFSEDLQRVVVLG